MSSVVKSASTAPAGPVIRPKSSIAGMVGYKPQVGKPGKKAVIRLNVNEGALGPSPKAMAAMTECAAEMHRYPPVDASGLVQAIGARWDVDPERVVLGCGSDQLIQVICLAFLEPGDEVIYTQYGFLMFPAATRIAGGVPVIAPDDGFTASIDNILAKVTDRTRIVFLANPNNPTGTMVDDSEVRRLRAALPENVLLVLDSAYAEYVTRPDYTAGIGLVEETENTVMLRTFSKMFGMAGLRLGWGYCPKPIADVLYSVNPPYSINYPSLAAGVAAVQDRDFFDRSIAHNERLMPAVQDELRSMGLEPMPTVTNFCIVRFPDEPGRDADAAKNFLAGRDILVRDMKSYGEPAFIRMSLGTDAEMRTTLDAIRDFLNGANA